MILSAFASLGLLRLTGHEPESRAIYESIIESLDPKERGGKGFACAPGTYMEAWAYSTAMGLARANQRAREAGDQPFPWKALEGLAKREKELGIVPTATATIDDRKADVAHRIRLPSGGSSSAITAGLQELLGADFVAYRPTPVANAKLYPAALGDWPMTLKTPDTARKIVKLEEPADFVGTPITRKYSIPPLSLEGTIDLSWTLVVGDVLVFDPGRYGQHDRVTVTAVSEGAGDRTFTATFARPHDPGTFGFTHPIPFWRSTKRHSLVIVTAAIAGDREKRRQIHDFMKRHVRDVTSWMIVEGTSTASIPFKIGEPSIGRRTLATVAL